MKKLFLLFLFLSLLFSAQTHGQWQWVSNTFNNMPVFIVESMGTYLYAGTDGNLVYRSSDHGINWIQINSGLTGTKAYCFAELSPYVYVGTSGGLFRSTNYGNNWVSMPFGASAGDIKVVGNTIYAVGDYSAGKSTNYGLSWISIKNEIPVAAAPYCIALQDSLAFIGTNTYGIYKSTNMGNNWTSVNNGLSSNLIFDILFKDNFVFAGTGNNGGIFRTSNYGSNWISVNNGFSANMSFSFQKLNYDIYVGTSDGGVWKSSNNGANWSFYNDSLPATTIRGLRIIDGYLWAASYNFGVWKRYVGYPNEINNNLSEIPKLSSLSQNYPNPFNPTTNIIFDLPKSGFTKISVYDAIGRLITTLLNQDLRAGSYKVDWDASNYPSGVYFYKLEAGDFTETKKMILLK
jgi:photosystem II stability/assembly factor-like uncharacterized protein